MISRLYQTMRRWGISRLIGWKQPWILTLALVLSGISAHSQSLPATAALDTTSDLPSEVLARARTSVERLFEQSAGMSCTESVTQSILDKYDRTLYEEHSLFNYRFQADAAGKSLKFVESREELQASFRDPGRTVLMTDGFGNMLLILHPAYAASYTFEPDGDEVISGIHTVRLRFSSVPGTSSPVMLQIRGQNYSVALDGTVWIEPQRGSVVKLVAFAGSALNELGMQRIRSEIQYLPTELGDPEEFYWTPASAVIDVETARHHWRNIHAFTAYKKFPATEPAIEGNGTLKTISKPAPVEFPPKL